MVTWMRSNYATLELRSGGGGGVELVKSDRRRSATRPFESVGWLRGTERNRNDEIRAFKA